MEIERHIVDTVRSARGMDAAGNPRGLQAYTCAVSEAFARAAGTRSGNYAIVAALDERKLNPDEHAEHPKLPFLASTPHPRLPGVAVTPRTLATYRGREPVLTADIGTVEVWADAPIDAGTLESVRRATTTLCEKLEDLYGIARAAAGSDHLTRLPTRGAIDPFVSSVLAMHATPLHAYFLDMHALKALNEFSYEQGDRALRHVSGNIGRAVRAASGETPYLVARVGGDEFVALTMAADRDGVERAIREAVERPLELHRTVDGIEESLLFTPGLAIGTSTIRSASEKKSGLHDAMEDLQQRKPASLARFYAANPDFAGGSDGRATYTAPRT